MKKILILTILLTMTFSVTSFAQFGIQSKIKKKYQKMGNEQAEKQKDEAEEKGMEEADRNLDKATQAAEPGIQAAEDAEKKGEEYTLIGIQKYGDFTERYEDSVAGKNPDDYKRYGFETAIVIYDVKGSSQGIKTLYIDMGGYKYAEYNDIKRKKTDEKTGSILVGSDMISIDFENRSAMKMHNPMAYLLANPEIDWEETGNNMLIKLGYDVIGQESIAGKKCDIWKQGKHMIWVWKGLTLKSEIGKNVETATSVKIDIDVPKDVFEIPEGFELESIGTDDLFPDFETDSYEEDEMSEAELNELLDEIETMSYVEYKEKVLIEEPDADDDKIKQSYLLLRQQAKRRHSKEKK
jgi:hypothetical protein